MKRLLIIAALGLALAGCSTTPSYNPNLSAGVAQAVHATDAATRKANEGLDKICANYELADAAFQIAVTFAGNRIPQSYVDAEAVTVAYLRDLCANRPQDAKAALAAAQKAYASILAIRDRFRKA